MAIIEYWIQLENRRWDACPNNIDRVHGEDIETALGAQGAPPILATLVSPETGVVKTRTMYLPVNEGIQIGIGGDRTWKPIDALILRRYTANWAAPDDRKVNPWDLNEPDPTDNGTMGTIPGPTLECNVGDRMVVHFRNKDFRPGLDAASRAHSLHPHGVAFAPQHDGAFPLSPPDPTQPIPAEEAALWASVGVTGGLKKGDRVPPGGSFTYTWDTFGWPTTAGIWHYHDHSVCDSTNVILGARGFLIVHNPEDPDDVIQQDLPQGRHNGNLTRLRCFPVQIDLPLLQLNLEALRRVRIDEADVRLVPATEDPGASSNPRRHGTHRKGKGEDDRTEEMEEAEHAIQSEFAIAAGPFTLELAENLQLVRGICFRRYVNPPAKLQILQYYSELPGVGMTINARRFLGNAPTVIAGVNTKMRFGLAAMNNLTFHTFHLHGHRWVIPGPPGTDPGAIQNSAQVQAVSQFEDTRIFGPANSFSFTINQGSFMGSRFTPDPSRAPGVGEWHMHCHVLSHMMPGGMMGSLLVIQGGEIALALPKGMPCGHAEMPGHEEEEPHDGIHVEHIVDMQSSAFLPNALTIDSGDTVKFVNQDPFQHTVDWDTAGAPPNSGIINAGASYTTPAMNTPGVFNYHCALHGAAGVGMHGSITVNP